jgi:hypothetical protein
MPRRKDLKNPRKKHRMKFAQAVVRRKGQVRLMGTGWHSIMSRGVLAEVELLSQILSSLSWLLQSGKRPAQLCLHTYLRCCAHITYGAASSCPCIRMQTVCLDPSPAVVLPGARCSAGAKCTSWLRRRGHRYQGQGCQECPPWIKHHIAQFMCVVFTYVTVDVTCIAACGCRQQYGTCSSACMFKSSLTSSLFYMQCVAHCSIACLASCAYARQATYPITYILSFLHTCMTDEYLACKIN